MYRAHIYMEVRELLWLQTSAVLLLKLRHWEAKSLVQDREVVSRGVGSGVYHFSCIIGQNMSLAKLSFKGGGRFMFSSCDHPGRREDILKRGTHTIRPLKQGTKRIRIVPGSHARVRAKLTEAVVPLEEKLASRKRFHSLFP